MITRVIQGKRPRSSAFLLLIGGAIFAAVLVGAVALAVWLTDSGTVDVQVADKTTSVVDATTNQGAFISYFGDSDTTFGSSGTGVFVPFVRLQASPTEAGFNTDAPVTFDTKTGKWTHSIKVSQIPQRPCPQLSPSLICFELFVDINEDNTNKHISLNTVDVWFTDSATLTGYPFTPSATTTEQYLFNGQIKINDVNQGSGRGDLRYDIPINDPAHPIALPPNCNYGNTACATYFVLYSQWGAPAGTTYKSDGGFEEWKVRVYPVLANPTLSTTIVATGSSIGSSAYDTADLTGNTADAGGTVTYKLYSNNDCTGEVDDLTPATNTVVNGAVPDSDSHTFNTAGTWYFWASYSGDPKNNPASSGCADEPITIGKNTPSPSSLPQVQIRDTISVTGFAAPSAGAPDVLVGLYSNSGCTTQIGSDKHFTVPALGGSVSGVTDWADITTTGTYYFKVSYAGDDNNGSFDICTEHVDVNAFQGT